MTRQEPARVRVVAIGAGRVFEKYYRAALLASRELELAGVSETDESRAAWVRTELGVPVGRTLAELCGRVERFDAALVLSPPFDHARLACEALEHGLHVLVEKPMALSSEESTRMITVARRSGRHLLVSFNRRFCRGYVQLAKILASFPEHPDIRSTVVTDAAGWRPLTAYIGDAARGGDILADVASHQVDLAAWLMGESVASVSGARLESRGAERRVVFDLVFASGRRAMCAAGHGMRYEEGTFARIGGAMYYASPASLSRGPLPEAWLRTIGSVRSQADLVVQKLGNRPNATQLSFQALLRSFAEVIRGSRKGAIAGSEDGASAIRVIEACRKSLDAGGAEVEVHPSSELGE